MNKIILVSVSLLIFLIGIGCASAADLTADSSDAPILDDGVSQFGGIKDFNISCARPDVSKVSGGYISLGPGSGSGGPGSQVIGGFSNGAAFESHKNSNDKKLGSSATYGVDLKKEQNRQLGTLTDKNSNDKKLGSSAAYSVDLKKEQNRPLISFSDRPSFSFEQYINSTSDVDNLSII